MRKYGFMVFFLAILAAGGLLTVIDQSGGLGNFLPFLRITGDTSASTDYAEPWQAEQLFFLIGFVVVNIVGIGLTLAGLMWVLNRGVKVSEAESQAEEAAQDS